MTLNYFQYFLVEVLTFSDILFIKSTVVQTNGLKFQRITKI